MLGPAVQTVLYTPGATHLLLCHAAPALPPLMLLMCVAVHAMPPTHLLLCDAAHAMTKTISIAVWCCPCHDNRLLLLHAVVCVT